MAEMFRQGDVLVMRVNELPKQATKKQVEERVVLAWGEVTGHAHAIDVKFADMYEAGPETYIVTRNGAKLVHEEHSTIALAPGVYRVVRQREYAPGAPRYVAD